MFDPQMELLTTVLAAVVGADPEVRDWGAARAAAAVCGDLEEDVALAIECEDAEALGAILAQWTAGKRHAPEHDRAVLKRALKAFRKRLKVTLIDDASSLGGGPMSGGRNSAIVAITPPQRYPRAVWDELVRLGRLLDSKHGMYELPPGG
jgi:hypothetical protein